MLDVRERAPDYSLYIPGPLPVMRRVHDAYQTGIAERANLAKRFSLTAFLGAVIPLIEQFIAAEVGVQPSEQMTNALDAYLAFSLSIAFFQAWKTSYLDSKGDKDRARYTDALDERKKFFQK